MSIQLPIPFIFIFLLIIPAMMVAALPGSGADLGKTVIYRDTWGVPHIYAPTIEAGLYAVGWAQAQDHPEELLRNMLRGMGKLASAEGSGALDEDKVAMIWNFYYGSRSLADRIRPEILGHIQAFVRGINDYYARHPRSIPAWWGKRAVDEFMVIAYSRMFLQSPAFDDGLRDLERAGVAPSVKIMSRGSNQFAVSGKRTAYGVPLLLGDLHLPWEGPYRFWECRIHAGGLHAAGFTLPGIPYVGLGHNSHVAWSMTTGGPDCADVYELKLNNGGVEPSRYLYDGQWRELKKREYKVTVKGAGEKVLRFFDSHLGPLAAIVREKGYAVHCSLADAIDVLAPWYEFNMAKDFLGIKKGLALLQLFPHNVMAADDSGNIYYQRTGRVPRRPAGIDGSKLVDGTISRADWLGIHPATDLLQMANPPQGYMQNCNVPPDSMMPGSPFSLERTVPYLFADLTQQVAWGYDTRDRWINSRGARAVELLKADDRITVEKAMAIANDIRPFGASRWVDALLLADRHFGSTQNNNLEYMAGIREIKHWNFELAADSKPALKYAYWRIQLMRELGAKNDLARQIDSYMEPLGESRKPLSLRDDELKRLVATFAMAMTKLRSDFGTLEKTYGEVFRVGRGGRSWPCEGGMAEFLGLTTLRSVQYGQERLDHTRWAQSGQTSTGLVLLTKPPQSWTCVPWGQSDRLDSPHFYDQTEKLFSRRKLKPTWWTPQELAGHIESRTVLEVR